MNFFKRFIYIQTTYIVQIGLILYNIKEVFERNISYDRKQ